MEALKEMNAGTSIFNWRSGGIFDWLFILSKIDDEKIRKVCGTDSALYLDYLLYAAKFFGLLSIFSIILMTIYLSGEPLDANNFRLHGSTMSAMTALTILNVSKSTPKTTISFLYAILVVPPLGFWLILRYLNKYQLQSEK